MTTLTIRAAGLTLYVHHIAISTERLTNRLQEILSHNSCFASIGAMLSFLFAVVLFCPLLTSSKNAIKANVDPVIGKALQHDQNLKTEPAPQLETKDICGDPKCDLVCTEGQVGHDCNEDHDRPLVHQDPHQ